MAISLLSTDPINCEKCDYEASDMYDLDAHTWDDESIECNLCDQTFEKDNDLLEHKKESHNASIFQSTSIQKTALQCMCCKESFVSKRELVEHKKTKHLERVSACWKFTNGQCDFGNEKCWFDHSNASKSEIKCNFGCSEFLKHKKTTSPKICTTVQKCYNWNLQLH